MSGTYTCSISIPCLVYPKTAINQCESSLTAAGYVSSIASQKRPR